MTSDDLDRIEAEAREQYAARMQDADEQDTADALATRSIARHRLDAKLMVLREVRRLL